jgi:hypothetical protein
MTKGNYTLRFLTASPAMLYIAVVLAACVVYWPGLNGPYVLDDGENILQNPSVALTEISRDNILAALQGNHSGPLKRPVAALSFALNHYFNSGFYPAFAFKATNLAIHLVNGYLIYLLVLKLLGSPRLAGGLDDGHRRHVAIFTAAVWALHPLQLTNILYVVQRMNSLSALFVLAGLVLFVHGRMLLGTNGTKGLALMAGGTAGGMVFGLASKENAALLPVFALVIEYCFFRFQTPDKRRNRSLLLFYASVALLPAVVVSAYLLFNPDFILDSYLTRHFTVFERVLTETRILWSYAGLILFPASHYFSLFHDDITLSTSLLTPITTLFAVTSVLVALGLALAQAGRHPVVSFSILWFLGGHALESGFLGLELAYEHRNYLPSAGILFAVVYGLVCASGKTRHGSLVAAAALAAILLTFSFVTWNRANIWSDIHTLAEHTARTHPNSPRANDFAARVSLGVKRDMTSGINYILKGLRLAPEEVGFHIDLLILLNRLSAEIGHDIQRQSQQNNDQTFKVRITGLDETLEANRTKTGIRLSHESSNPEVVSELLATKPISVHGIFSLENLRRCMLDPPRSCAGLHDIALTWFTLAKRNPRTSRDYHAVLAGNIAMLYADAGDMANALDYIDQAVALLPDHVSYQVARAEYLIRLGHLEEAGRALDFIASTPAPPEVPVPMHESNIRKLREMYDKAARERRDNNLRAR